MWKLKNAYDRTNNHLGTVVVREAPVWGQNHYVGQLDGRVVRSKIEPTWEPDDHVAVDPTPEDRAALRWVARAARTTILTNTATFSFSYPFVHSDGLHLVATDGYRMHIAFPRSIPRGTYHISDKVPKSGPFYLHALTEVPYTDWRLAVPKGSTQYTQAQVRDLREIAKQGPALLLRRMDVVCGVESRHLLDALDGLRVSDVVRIGLHHSKSLLVMAIQSSERIAFYALSSEYNRWPFPPLDLDRTFPVFDEFYQDFDIAVGSYAADLVPYRGVSRLTNAPRPQHFRDVI